MRITPAKWDAEYTWLRDEDHIHYLRTSPLITVPKDIGKKDSEELVENVNTAGRNILRARRRRSSILGMAMQTFGALMLLTVMGLNGMLLPLLSIGMVLSGEIIFIFSLGHGGDRIRSELIR